MGIFSSEKIVNVGSTVYNLAGEEKDRPQFLQSLIVSNMLSETRASMGDTIRDGYLNGPAMRLRQFFRWARQPKNYGKVGMPTGQIGSGNEVNPKSVETYIPHPAGTDVWCQYVVVGGADYRYWAEQWVMVNRPSQLDKAWAAVYDKSSKQILIRFVDNSVVLFTPVDYHINAQYVYAYHTIITNPGNNLTISYGPDQLMIYRIGTGKPGLDALIKAGSSYGEFFPFIPVRLDNEFLSKHNHETAYGQASKAFQKSTGGHFDELVENLKDNENLDDIDFAYVVFGVSLNVVDMSCKRYLYTFFEKLMYSQENGPQAYQQWIGAATHHEETYNEWRVWKAKQGVYQASGGTSTDPGSELPRPAIPTPPRNSLQITSETELDTNYDIRLHWSYIVNGSGTGKGRPGARTNDCWLVYLGEDTASQKYYSESSPAWRVDEDSQKFRIYWQRSANAYTWLDVVGLLHHNVIYDGKTVTIGAKEALEDPDESGFIIPLHYETWRETPIMDTSQMGTACIFLVLNSYEETEKKWYESGIFRIFLIIIIAIVVVIVTGGAGIGLLGAHLTVGAALGFSGMAAAIVGAVVNAMASLVLTTILQKLTAGLGPIGPIIAAVVSIMIGNVITSVQGGTSIAASWSTLMRADNLLKLTEATGAGIQKMIQENTLQAVEDLNELNKQADAELLKVQEAYYAEFGYGKISIDPMELFTDAAQSILVESPSSFLARTLLTGSDIAEMSQDMLSNFAEYSLKLPDAFT